MRSIRGMLAALFGAAISLCTCYDASAAVTPPGPDGCPITPPPLQAGSTPTYPGRFWNPKRYGTGWDFLYDDRLAENKLFLLYWFTYGADGRPTWTIAFPREVASNDGHKRYQADLKQPDWNGIAVTNYRTVGSVAITIPNGSTTRAAIKWQWNEIGAADYTECVYDYFRDQMPLGAPESVGLNQAYTANWYDSVLDTAAGGVGSWGFDLVIGIDAAQNYLQIVTPQIFDVAGRPAWVQYGQLHRGMPPKNNTSNPGDLVYTKSLRGITTDCTATDQTSANPCIAAHVLTVGQADDDPKNRFYHIFSGPNAAKIAMKVSVPYTTTGRDAIEWPTPLMPARYAAEAPSVDVVRTTDVDRLVTDRTLCLVQQAGTNCSLTVSYTASRRYGSIYRYDLNNFSAPPTLLYSAIGVEGSFTESLPIGSRVKYRLFAEGKTPAAGDTPLSESAEVRVIGHVEVPDQPLVSLDGDLPTHDPTVGTLAGDAGVSGGAATYTIPVTVPPGRNGMQPDVALSYSSRGGNGVAGMGFSLSGLSSIHRCPQTKAQDGAARAVRFDAQDVLCLDGQRLMVVQGTYGQSGARYRTEIDNYTRVTQFGTLLDPIGCFVAETKSGRILHFGATVHQDKGTCGTGANARVRPYGAPAPLSWLVERVEDYAGNAMAYAYDNNDGGPQRETLVRSISYTLPSSDVRRVTFDYENRPADIGSNDNAFSALAGALSPQVKRLSRITTWVGAEKVRDYSFQYNAVNNGPTLSSYSGRSLLRRVTECAYDAATPGGTCRPPTTFDWNDKTPASKLGRVTAAGMLAPVLPTLTEIAASYPTPPQTGPGDPPIDPPEDPDPPGSVDGAGENPDGVEPMPGILALTPKTEITSDLKYFSVIGDVNGDGRREVLARIRSGDHQYKYQIGQTTPDRSFGQWVTIGDTQTFGIPGADDYNGDGYSDGLRMPQGGESKFLRLIRWKRDRGYWPANANEGFDALFDTVPTSVPATVGDTLVDSPADFDGDGRPDVLLRRKSSACPGASYTYNELAIYRNVITPTDTGKFELAVRRCLARTQSGSNVYGEQVVHVSDLDGDGRADIVIATDGRNTNAITSILTPTPKGTGIELAVRPGASLGLGEDASLLRRVLRWTDINGDGLADLVFAKNSDTWWNVILNRGNLSFTARIETTTAQHTNVGLTLAPSGFKYANHLKLHDIDGDGRAEFLRPARLAAALCPKFTEKPCESGSASGDEPYCDVYACPDDPATGRPIIAMGDRTLGNNAAHLYKAPYPGASADPSAYYMNAVKFVIGPVNPTTNLPAISVVDVPTDIIGTLSDFTENSDVFGDGLVDQINAIGCSNCAPATGKLLIDLPTQLPNGDKVNELVTANYTVYINENIGATRPGENRTEMAPRLPELLDMVTNGLGDEAVWDYSPLSSKAGRSEHDLPLYRTVQNPAASYADDDHFYFTSSMPVVASLYRSNGLGDVVGFRSVRYSYEEAMYNARGRGFQGFRTITQEPEVAASDAARRVRTTTVFEQKFPYTSLVKSATVSRTTAATPNTFEALSQETNTWADRAAAESSRIHQPYLASSIADRFEVEGACKGRTTRATTTNASWDGYGNLLSQTVDIGLAPNSVPTSCKTFVQSQTATTTSTYNNLTADSWWPGQSASSTVESSLGYTQEHAPPVGTSVSVPSATTTYTWNATTRALEAKSVTSGGVTRTTRSTYSGFHYGLPDSTSVEATDTAPRTTSFGYSPGRYFVASTMNAMNYASIAETRARDGQVAVVMDANGIAVKSAYDVFGKPIRVEKFKPGPTPGVAGTTPLEPPVRTAVSACTSASNCGGPYGDSADGQRFAAYRVTTVKAGAPTQIAWFDALGREVKTASRGFDPTESTPNLATSPWVQSIKQYDAMGQLSRESSPHCRAGSALCTQTAVRWTTFAYDAEQRVIAKVAPAADGPAGVVGPAVARDVKTVYDYSGGVTTVTTGRAWPNGASCSTDCIMVKRYNDLVGQLARTDDALGSSTRYWHDAANRPVAIVDAKNSVTRAEYDGFGNRTRSIDPNQGTWTFTYNGLGEVATQTDARGVVTSFVYDALGRTLTRTAKQTAAQGAYIDPVDVGAGVDNEQTVDTWSYNDAAFPLGSLASVNRTVNLFAGQTSKSSSTPWAESYIYDTVGRTSKITTRIVEVRGQEATPFETSLEYDETYNREKVRNYPSRLRVQSTYTAYGQSHRMRDADLQMDYLTIDQRDNWGNVARQMYGNNAAGLFASNPGSGQSQQRQWKQGGTSGVEVDRYDYAYDVFGNLTSQARSYVGSSRVESYAYDKLHRLKTAYSGTSDPVFGSVSYEYDAVGNLRAKSDYSNLLGQGVAEPYEYTSAAHPNAVTKVTQGSTVRTYSYDANGNLAGGAVHGLYDAQNLPRKLTRNGMSSVFDYAPNGQRYREQRSTEGAKPKLFLPFGLERTSERVTRHELGEAVVQLFRNGATAYESRREVWYNYQDRLGSTSAIADGNGLIDPKYYLVFDAFGMPRNGDFTVRYTGSSPITGTIGVLSLGALTERGFTGHQHLDNTQLIHMNGRAYDPRLGRFLSVDPIIQFPTNSQSLNPYSYILNNPLAGRDPTGYQSCSETKTEGAEVGDTCTFMARDPRSANKLGEYSTVVVGESSTGKSKYERYTGAHGETTYRCVSGCSKNGGKTTQGVSTKSHSDGSKSGAADIENARSTPGQEVSKNFVSLTKDGANAVLDASEYVLPQDGTEVMLHLGLGPLAKLIRTAGKGTNASLMREMDELSDGIKYVTAGTTPVTKAINLPAWRKIGIDMPHVISGHTAGGSRVSPKKDLFPTTMDERQIERAIRQSYRNAARVGTQVSDGQTRLLMRGSYQGLDIEMWVNLDAKMIETAYPMYR